MVSWHVYVVGWQHALFRSRVVARSVELSGLIINDQKFRACGANFCMFCRDAEFSRIQVLNVKTYVFFTFQVLKL